MPLNREERKLLHQKSKQPTFGNGKPDSNQGNEGDIAYRQVEGSGLVQYVKQNNSWVAIASQGDMPETRDVTTSVSSGGGGVGSHSHGEFIKKNGSVTYTGSQSFGDNNITNVGNLDVNGSTTLDKVTIDTTDGAFSVSGANPINLTTTGTNKITLTSGNDIDITPTGDLDVDANNITVDTGREYTGSITGNYLLQGTSNITTQATGSSANTILIQNTNNHNSSFEGIHLKTDSGNTSSCFNRILIECDNIASKGADYGVDVRSENNIRIRAENANNGNLTGLLMRATGPIDIGVGSSLTPHSGDERVKVHGLCELTTLFKTSGEAINCSTHNVAFDQLDTQKLMRNFTYVATSNSVLNGNTLEIVSSSALENTIGTMYMVIVAIKQGSNEWQNVAICSRIATTTWLVTTLGQNGSTSNYGTISADSGGSATGIIWTNNIGSEVQAFATAQRIVEASDYP